MERGRFITDNFNQEKPTISMVDWVEPTIYNNGDSTVNINGMKLKPGGIFRLGPAGVKMHGTVHLFFPEAGNHEVKVSYTLLEKSCPTEPPV